MRRTDVRLVALSGPTSGQTFTLTGTPVSIGRGKDDQIVVLDAGVSRHHCTIAFDGGDLTITDHGSHNGTFVNGRPADRQALHHGDEIRLGASVFLVVYAEHEEETPRPAALDEEPLVSASTVVLRLEDTTYLKLAPDPDGPRLSARASRDLGALLRIVSVIHAARDLQALQRTLLDLVADVVPVEAGAIVLCDPAGGGVTSVVGWPCSPGAPCPISRTVTRKVLSERVALMSNDAAEDAAIGAAESVASSRVRSVICAPLLLFDQPRGAIYLTTSDPRHRFDEEDLQFVTAVGRMAAHAFENVEHLEWLERERRRLEASLDIAHSMIGDSTAMQEVYRFIARVAPADSTVLIRGESGTGKELVARAIHRNSRRGDRPFVPISCAALPESLLESELFGHERGAFTGAIAQKRGRLEVADRGTVFLDEIGELSPALQAKLLRVLQEREFERVGGTRPIKVDIRVIAATNRNLAEALREGRFRQDLYYRLDVLAVTLPPLRERRDDIPLLAGHFLELYSERCKRRVRGVSPEAEASMLRYDWPGNVRELENAIERAVVLGSSDRILPEDLPEAVVECGASAGDLPAGYHEGVVHAKRALILDALARGEGSFTRAAQLLGVHPNYLHRLVRQLDLRERLSKR